jgi:hypothetical protein
LPVFSLRLGVAFPAVSLPDSAFVPASGAAAGHLVVSVQNIFNIAFLAFLAPWLHLPLRVAVPLGHRLCGAMALGIRASNAALSPPRAKAWALGAVHVVMLPGCRLALGDIPGRLTHDLVLRIAGLAAKIQHHAFLAVRTPHALPPLRFRMP